MKMAGILLIYILGIYFLLTKMVQLEDEAVVGVKKTHKELSENTHSSNEKAIQYVASNMIKEAPKIAITFDDGPSPAWTPKLLDGLKERNVKATFFLIGENAENTPELVKRESEEGHLVGNHTYHHVEITRVPDETAKEEILMTNEVITGITGEEVSYMRPPFGAWQKKLEWELDVMPVMWTIDPLDWTTNNEDEIVNKVVTQAKENDIILLHDCYESSVNAALRIVDILINGDERMDLFDYMREQNMEKEAPLASRLRPTTLEEVVGQQHIIGKDKLLYRAIKADKLSSVIFYGPPGTGKTTLAKVIANTTSAEFTQINATTAGKKDMEEVINKAKEMQGMYRKKTILFVDEIHRFNKGQQDYLLPFVEDGTIILIGATTENPYFEVNGALLSRSSIFELQPLAKEDIKTLITRAVYDTVKGMGSYQAVIDEDALEFLADISGGDARSALNAVELGILTTERSADGKIRITLDVASECIQKRVVKYDKTGDNHYDTISAFIKSMRGSDPDAAVYYLAKMLYAGEDIKFIARRIMICASEDVGNADPMALTVAVSASQAVERIGMPEAQIILSQAVTYVATAPKSNAACNAIFDAMASVKRTKTTVPSHLQDAHYKGAQKLGHGIGYKYAHNYPHHYVEQQYLPDEIVGEKFYVPSENGHEKEIKEWMRYIREDQ